MFLIVSERDDNFGKKNLKNLFFVLKFYFGNLFFTTKTERYCT